MSIESYSKITPERLDSIKNLTFIIGNKIKLNGTVRKETLFRELFGEPGFPSQPIVDKDNRLDEFKLALLGLDKTLYKITEDEITYVNPQS